MRIPPSYRHDGPGDLREAEYEQMDECSRSFTLKGSGLLLACGFALGLMMWAAGRAVLG